MKILTPSQTAQSLQVISLDSLIQRGVKLLLLDIDNTIVPRGDSEAPQSVLDWLVEARKKGLKLCLMSNNTKKHFPSLEAYVDHYATFQKKPWPWNFRRLMGKFGVSAYETCVIGDQIFTDILGGNNMKIHTILTRRQRNYGKFTRKLMHHIEDRMWKKFE